MATTASNRMSDIARALALGLCTLFLLGTAQADEEEGSKALYDLDIPAQGLNAALQAFALAANHKLLYRSELAEGKISQALKGSYSLREAVEALLAGTDLMFEITPAAVVLIRDQEIGANNDDDSVAASAAAAGGMNFVGHSLSLAQTPESRQDQARNDDDTVMDPEHVSDENPRGIPEILVVGKKTLNMDVARTANDAQPYVVFNRDSIESAGAVNLEGFLKNRLSMGTNSVAQAQQAGISTSTISLRGLGSDETLILLDGHRIAGFNNNGTAAQPDLNAIPLSAIERIEVLPTTASGIYGGGATGGVINIVLRRDYSGVDAKLTYGSTFVSDVSHRTVDISAGIGLEGGRTNVLFTGSYSDQNPLLAQERDFIQRGREHILKNNPSHFFSSPFVIPLAATPNIAGIDPLTFQFAELTLKDGTSLGSPFTFIPLGYPGTNNDGGAALLANAGQYNFDLAHTAQNNGGGLHALLNNPTVSSAMLTVRREFSDNLEVFLEVNASENDGNFVRNNVTVFPAIIPATAPNNPFQQDIQVSIPTVGADASLSSAYKNQRGLVGFIVQLPHEWKAEMDFTWNRSRFSFDFPGGATPELAAAVADGSVDVLRDLNEFPVDFRPYGGAPTRISPSDATLRDTTFRVAGPLPWKVPGGTPIVSALLEYRDESFGDSTFMSGISGSRQWTPPRSQKVTSIYLETKVPFVTARNRKRGVELLELQLAVRGDAYEVMGSSTINLNDPQPIVRFKSRQSSIDPTLGIRYAPVDGLMLRTSYGTGYLPPSVNQLAPLFEPVSFVASFLSDPLRGGEPLGLVTFSGEGSGSLRPEKSTSWSFGGVLTPPWMEHLRASVDWTRIEKHDAITSISTSSQAFFESADLLAGLVTRAPRAVNDPFPVGRVTGINSGLFNIATMDVQAVDIALNYSLDTMKAGSFDFTVAATKLIDLKTQLTPIAAPVENAGVAGVFLGDGGGVKWKINSSIAWQKHGLTLGVSTRFFDSYFLNTDHTIVENQGAATVPSQMYHDLFGSYQFSSDTGISLLSNSELRFGIYNFLNKKPPVDVTSANSLFYSFWGDPRLSSYYISFRKSLGSN